MDNDLLNLWLLPAPTREDMRALVEEVQELRCAAREAADLLERAEEWRGQIRELEGDLADAQQTVDELRDMLAGR